MSSWGRRFAAVLLAGGAVVGAAGCAVPDSLSEADAVGTWVGEPTGTELVLKADGSFDARRFPSGVTQPGCVPDPDQASDPSGPYDIIRSEGGTDFVTLGGWAQLWIGRQYEFFGEPRLYLTLCGEPGNRDVTFRKVSD